MEPQTFSSGLNLIPGSPNPLSFSLVPELPGSDGLILPNGLFYCPPESKFRSNASPNSLSPDGMLALAHRPRRGSGLRNLSVV